MIGKLEYKNGHISVHVTMVEKYEPTDSTWGNVLCVAISTEKQLRNLKKLDGEMVQFDVYENWRTGTNFDWVAGNVRPIEKGDFRKIRITVAKKNRKK